MSERDELYSPTSAATEGSLPNSPWAEDLAGATSSEVAQPNSLLFKRTGSASQSTERISAPGTMSMGAKKRRIGLSRAGQLTTERGSELSTTSILGVGLTEDRLRNTDDTTEDVFVQKKATPRLLAGAKFDKICNLKPNRWIKVGRSEKAQLLLKNKGVSREHCHLMWDSSSSVVELRHVSSAGFTLVNGDVVKKDGRRNLSHGDRLRVQGKGINYDFLLDMRPVNGSAIGDPKEMQTQNRRRRAIARDFTNRREELRKQLINVDKAVDACDKRVFEKETEYYELMARRRVRFKDIEEKESTIKMCVSEIEQKKVELATTRDDWLQKLQDTMDMQAEQIAPYTTRTNNVQVMLEKLQSKKIDLERDLHPEKYEIQKVEIEDDPSMAGSTHPMSRRGSLGQRSAAGSLADDDLAGEEEAFVSKSEMLALQDAGSSPDPLTSPEPDSPPVSPDVPASPKPRLIQGVHG